MPPSATHVSVLLFGAVFLAAHITLVSGGSPKERIKIDRLGVNPQDSGADNDDHSLQTRGLWDNLDLSSLFNSVISNVNAAKREVAETDDVDGDGSEEHDTESINSGSRKSFNNFGNSGRNRVVIGNIVGRSGSPINIGNIDGEEDEVDGEHDTVINSGGNRVVIGDIVGRTGSPISIGNIGSNGGVNNFGNSFTKLDVNGVIIHVLDSGNRGVSRINNKIYIGDKLICSDMKKTTAKPTHQKTPDGERWYTNLQVGQPMSQAEAEQFDKEWAEHERQQKARTDALNARLKREAEERAKYQRELQARLKREQEERQRQQLERMDALKRRLKRQAEDSARRQSWRNRSSDSSGWW